VQKPADWLGTEHAAAHTQPSSAPIPLSVRSAEWPFAGIDCKKVLALEPLRSDVDRALVQPHAIGW